MSKKIEGLALCFLPIIILAMLVVNARIMSVHYLTLSGLEKSNKVYGEQIMVKEAKETGIHAASGQLLKIDVTAVNTGNFIWSHDGPNPVHLSYQILDHNKQLVLSDGLRTTLPYDLRPGQRVTVPMSLKAPDEVGDYIVQLDMVQEGEAWFGEKGSKPIVLLLDVAKT